MRPIFKATACLALLIPSAALADPVGTFDVRGINSNDGSHYDGTVRITRTGETYKVVWTLGSEPMSGIGVGIRFVDGRIITGPASKHDKGISVAYQSGDAVGTAVYFEQPDGTWHGTWAYSGWDHIATEDWLPKDRKPVVKAEDKADTQVKSIEPQRSLSTPIPAQAGPKS